MKKSLYIFALLAVTLTACKDENDEPIVIPQPPTWQAPEVTHTLESPEWPVGLPANDSKPEWTNPDFNLYPQSMTSVIVLPELMEPYQSDNDVIAAFIGDECRGIGTILTIPYGEYDEDRHYCFVNIKGGDTESGKVVFKYYFDQLHTILTADDNLTFHADLVHGTVAEPVTPNFMPSDCHDIYLQINNELASFHHDQDHLSIFVDGQCRGYSFQHGNGKYHSMILANPDDMAVVKYFSYDLAYIFESEPMRVADLLKSSPASYTPVQLKTKGHYPLWMTLIIDLPDYLARTASEKDQIAAFIAGECRGVADIIEDKNGQKVYYLYVCKALEDPSRVTVKYYQTATGQTYQTKPYTFKQNEFIGDFLDPEIPDFTKGNE